MPDWFCFNFKITFLSLQWLLSISPLKQFNATLKKILFIRVNKLSIVKCSIVLLAFVLTLNFLYNYIIIVKRNREHHFSGFKLVFCVLKADEGGQLRSAVMDVRVQHIFIHVSMIFLQVNIYNIHFKNHWNILLRLIRKDSKKLV